MKKILTILLLSISLFSCKQKNNLYDIKNPINGFLQLKLGMNKDSLNKIISLEKDYQYGNLSEYSYKGILYSDNINTLQYILYSPTINTLQYKLDTIPNIKLLFNKDTLVSFEIINPNKDFKIALINKYGDNYDFTLNELDYGGYDTTYIYNKDNKYLRFKISSYRSAGYIELGFNNFNYQNIKDSLRNIEYQNKKHTEDSLNYHKIDSLTKNI